MMQLYWTGWFWCLVALGAAFVVGEGYSYVTKDLLLTGWVREKSIVYPFAPWVCLVFTFVVMFHFWLERK